jgi:magnesium transporter
MAADKIEQENSQDRLRTLRDTLAIAAFDEAREAINSLHPAEIARLLEALPLDEREIAWDLVDPDHDGDVLLYVNEDIRSDFISDMEHKELIAATEGLDTDDLADIIQDLPEQVIQELLRSMGYQDRVRLEAVLSYPEDSAGGLMNTDTVTVRQDVSLDVVLRYLRVRGHLPETTDSLIVVDREDKYIGLLPITDLLVKSPTNKVSEIMKTDIEAISAYTSAREVAALFETRDLVSSPVVDDSGKLLGRITIDDVVDVIRETADTSLMRMAGLKEEEDMFAPVVTSARRRGVWLGLNLVTVLIASWVIGLFDTTIENMVALAILMPIVASMGGVAGSQTLTIVIRGMALGQIGVSNARQLMAKELAVGALNGFVWAIVIAAVAVVWFHSSEIGFVIGCAIAVNLFAGALAGVLIPLAMHRFGADPALGGSVLLTTVTDVVGFFCFLGLATIILM